MTRDRHVTTAERSEMVRMYQAGEKLMAIAAHFNVGPSYPSELMRELGLANRGRGRRPLRPEQVIHRAVAEHLRTRSAPGVVWWHTPNGAYYGARSQKAIQGAVMKSLGVRAGVSDIVALHDGKFFALELKAPGGRPTEEQLHFHDDVRAAGGYVCLAEGIDQALRALEMWGLLRGVSG